MKYRAFGLNHNTAPVAIRELLEFSDAAIEQLYESVQLVPGAEWLLISTCNRTEVYMRGPEEAMETILLALAGENSVWPADNSFSCSGPDAVRHVVEVVSGIRSQIVGDGQILNQTKTAYRLASSAGTLGAWMHRLMHTAFATAKDVITKTDLSRTGSSVARSSVQTAIEHLLECNIPEPWSFAVLGGGRMAALVLQELSGEPRAAVTLLNRTQETAKTLAGKYGMDTAPWEERYRISSCVDVVIAATGAQEVVLRADTTLDRSNSRDALLIDIAVPRNIDPDMDSRTGYRVLNIDELLSGNDSGRDSGDVGLSREVAHARELCDGAVEDVMGWQRERAVLQSTIQTLYDTFEEVRSREVNHNLHRFDPASRGQIDSLTRSIMQKLLAIPVVRLKTMAATDMDLAGRVEILNALFERVTCEE